MSAMVCVAEYRDVHDNVQQQQQPQAASNKEHVTLDNNVKYWFDNINVLGKGNQGSVFKAASADGSLIALKIAPKVSSQNDREYANLVKVNHPSVVRVLGQATVRRGTVDCLAIGMELVDGTSYDTYLKTLKNGKIDWQDAAEDFIQLICGMKEVHNQVLTLSK